MICGHTNEFKRRAARNYGRPLATEAKFMIQQDFKAATSENSSCLFIGQDRGGHWVVKDARSLCGGLFANRNEAIRFAMYECQRRPQSVIMLPDELELDGPIDQDRMNNPGKLLAVADRRGMHKGSENCARRFPSERSKER
jgi:hypothetical protein